MDEHAAEFCWLSSSGSVIESPKAGMKGPSSILTQNEGPSLSEVPVFVNLTKQVPLVAFVILSDRSKQR